MSEMITLFVILYMFILFSCSEGKVAGGLKKKISFSFGGVEDRQVFLHAYQEGIRSGGNRAKKITGWKDEQKIGELPVDLVTAPVLPAIERYAGVGFQYLGYDTCSSKAQSYLKKHMIIFSQLFGPLLAEDVIPETKLKQCTTFAGENIATYYRTRFSEAIDEWVAGDVVLDLRAGVYQSYYHPKGTVVTCRFLKNGKTVNHWSKAYRGVLARTIAEQQPKTIDALANLSMEGMQLKHRENTQKETILTYEIIG